LGGDENIRVNRDREWVKRRVGENREDSFSGEIGGNGGVYISEVDPHHSTPLHICISRHQHFRFWSAILDRSMDFDVVKYL
jgi:hypothetical protein